MYYEACFKKCKNDMKKIWKTIGEVINKTKKGKYFLISLEMTMN